MAVKIYVYKLKKSSQKQKEKNRPLFRQLDKNNLFL